MSHGWPPVENGVATSPSAEENSMNRILLPAMLAFCIGSAFALSASASTTNTAAADRNAADRFCLRDTGSHLTSHLYSKQQDGRKFDDCVNANGRVYTREDIERTGAITTADALKKLDPSIH
jgi:hypothetical protein